MPSRKNASRRKCRSVKRLLDDVLPKKSTESKAATAVIDLTTKDSPSLTRSSQSSNDMVSTSSSMLKNLEEMVVKKNQGTSPDPTLLSIQQGSSSHSQQQQWQQQRHEAPQQSLEKTAAACHEPVSANSEFSYSPMYRRYFGLTPPNPRLCNPRLLEDYIDWYINVYMEEEQLPWRWIDVGTAAERVRQGNEEAIEEAKRLAASATATSPTSK